jgi:hypothetical protein
MVTHPHMNRVKKMKLPRQVKLADLGLAQCSVERERDMVPWLQ